MVSLLKIPDMIGYLILNEFGAVLESGGDLKNDERCANVVTSIINLTDSVDPKTFPRNDCQRISVVFEQHSYTICLSNKKIYVVKRSNNQMRANNSTGAVKPNTTVPAPVAFEQPNQTSDTESSSQQSI